MTGASTPPTLGGAVVSSRRRVAREACATLALGRYEAAPVGSRMSTLGHSRHPEVRLVRVRERVHVDVHSLERDHQPVSSLRVAEMEPVVAPDLDLGGLRCPPPFVEGKLEMEERRREMDARPA